MGCFRKSTPTAGLEVAFGMQPLALLARTEARLAAARIQDRNKEKWDGFGKGSRKGHMRLADTGGRNPSDKISKFFDYDNVAPVDFSSFRTGTPRNTAENAAYSDGSKNYDGACGFGVVVRKEGYVLAPHPVEGFELEENGSIGYRADPCLLYTSPSPRDRG